MNCANLTRHNTNQSDNLNLSQKCLNGTSNSTDGSVWIPPGFDASAKNIILAITLTAIDVVTIFGNLLVLVAFFVDRKLFHPFNMFIFNLAVTDFLVAITAMTFYTIDTLFGYWPFGEVMCGVWIYFDFAMTFASVFTLVAISVDRFWCCTWAVHYRIHNNKIKTAIVLAIIWFFVFAIWTPPFIGDRLKHNEVHFCIWEPSDNTEFVIFVALVGHYIPCIIMVFCYIKVFMVMRRQVAIVGSMGAPNTGASTTGQQSCSVQGNSMGSYGNRHGTLSSAVDQVTKPQGHSQGQNLSTNGGTCNNDTPSSNIKSSDGVGSSSATERRVPRPNQGSYYRERRIFITLTYVISSYLICWFPFYVAFDTYAWKPNVVPADLYTFFFWMTYVNSTLNPFIYAYTSKEFRSAFIKVLSKMCVCAK